MITAGKYMFEPDFFKANMRRINRLDSINALINNNRLLLVTALLCSCFSANAGQLGRATVLSFIGQPLEARIAIDDTNVDELSDARVSLAPLTEWLRSGLPPLPEGMRIDVDLLRGTNDPYVLVRTQQPLTEPVLQLLVNLQLTSQQVQSKPFILFLDPMPSPGDAARAQLRARRGNTIAGSTRNARSTPRTPATARVNRPNQSASANAGRFTNSEYGPVSVGETLWSIGTGYASRTGFSVQQIVVAIQQLNPNAFEDPSNMNTLRSGITLDLPQADLVARTDLEQAIIRIREQDTAWRGGRLEIVNAQNNKIAVAGAGGLDALEKARLEEALLAAQRENEVLRQQVDQLEEELGDSENERRNIEEQIDSLRSQISDQATTVAETAIDEVSRFETLPADQSTLNNEGALEANNDDLEADTSVTTFSAQVEEPVLEEPTNANIDDSPVSTESTIDTDTDSTVTEPAEVTAAPEESAEQTQQLQPQNTPAAAGESNWSWPIWNSNGWRNLVGSLGFIPDGLIGFLVVLGLLLILLLVPMFFLLRKFKGQGQDDGEYKDMLDRLAERRSVGKATGKQADTPVNNTQRIEASDIEEIMKAESNIEPIEESSIEGRLTEEKPIEEPPTEESIDDFDIDLEMQVDVNSDELLEDESELDDLIDSLGQSEDETVDLVVEVDDAIDDTVDDIEDFSDDLSLDFDELTEQVSSDAINVETIDTESLDSKVDDVIDEVTEESDVLEAIGIDAEIDSKVDGSFSLDGQTPVEEVASDAIDNELEETIESLSLDLGEDNADLVSDSNGPENSEVQSEDTNLESLVEALELDDELDLDADFNIEGESKTVQSLDTEELDDNELVSFDLEEPTQINNNDIDEVITDLSSEKAEDIDDVMDFELDLDPPAADTDTVDAQQEPTDLEANIDLNSEIDSIEFDMDENVSTDETITNNLNETIDEVVNVTASTEDHEINHMTTEKTANDAEQDNLFDEDDAEIKLDLARAYQSMGDREAMLTILDEISGDLSDEQQEEIMRLRSDL